MVAHLAAEENRVRGRAQVGKNRRRGAACLVDERLRPIRKEPCKGQGEAINNKDGLVQERPVCARRETCVGEEGKAGGRRRGGHAVFPVHAERKGPEKVPKGKRRRRIERKMKDSFSLCY